MDTRTREVPATLPWCQVSNHNGVSKRDLVAVFPTCRHNLRMSPSTSVCYEVLSHSGAIIVTITVTMALFFFLLSPHPSYMHLNIIFSLCPMHRF